MTVTRYRDKHFQKEIIILVKDITLVFRALQGHLVVSGGGNIQYGLLLRHHYNTAPPRYFLYLYLYCHHQVNVFTYSVKHILHGLTLMVCRF